MFCKRCGKEIPNNSNVCQYCGSQVTPRTSANTYTNFNNTTVNQAPSAPQKNQKKTPWKIIAPVVAVLLIIAIVFGVFACANNKKKAAEEKLRQILEESTTKPIVEFMCEDYNGDGRYEAFAVVGESEDKAEYIEYSEADICHVNEEEAEVIKESVRGHSNGTIEVGNTIYVSLEVYDDGVETGKSFIYTSDDNKYVEPDVSGKYSDVHEEDGKIFGKDENGNEIEVELTDRNEDESEDNKEENKQVAKPKYQTVATSYQGTFAIRDDGTVLSTIEEETEEPAFFTGRGNVSSWRDIVSVSTGGWHTVGLKKDGTVIATKVLRQIDQFGINEFDVDYGQSDVSEWTDIVAISASTYHTVGLKSDGTVVSTKIKNNKQDVDRGQTDVENWTDISMVYTTYQGTIGVKSDGTVVAVGDAQDTNGWTDIVDIDSDMSYQDLVIVGVKADGTVIATGNNESGACAIDEWTNIKTISTNGFFTVGLKNDGTIIITDIKGQNNAWLEEIYVAKNWTNIKNIDTTGSHIIGLKGDGTVVTTRRENPKSYPCDGAIGWSDIVAIFADGDHYVGVKSDGTMIGTQCRNYEDGAYGQGDKTDDWTNIRLPE
ncbi:MAG: zinc-ribbon domain-containing protein [Clostridia bacterium]|nr:zinc-ribbon domain-containing protein [Clostridia bacterium]